MSAWPYACLLEKYGLEIDQNDLELVFISRLSKKFFFTTLF